ncbi:MAG: thioredoxin family protein [Kiritimatiellales bacterium]|nr:thioredoxin family protein [Kiritimatiellales bacterium]MCF7863785.1 thioredoxin family protein [Kiritimatiellales bacterium]
MKKWLIILAGAVVFIGGCKEGKQASTVPAKEPAIDAGQIEHGGWLTDFEKAVAKAKVEGKYVLIDFSGSDWCGWCIKLDKEVFSQQAFKDYAKDHLVLLLVDWPQQAANSKEVQAKSQPLMEKFGIDSFPTVILLDPNGEPVDKTGYRPGGAEAYVDYISKVIASAKK